MSESIKNKPVELGITRIKCISFKVDESLQEVDSDSLITLFLEYKTGFNIVESLFELTLRITYRFPDQQQIAIQAEVLNQFKVLDLANYIGKDNEINIPPNGLITMVSLSLSHSRAILAVNLAGTVFNNLLMPIANPIDVARQFFGEKIMSKKSITQ